MPFPRSMFLPTPLSVLGLLPLLAYVPQVQAQNAASTAVNLKPAASPARSAKGGSLAERVQQMQNQLSEQAKEIQELRERLEKQASNQEKFLQQSQPQRTALPLAQNATSSVASQNPGPEAGGRPVQVGIAPAEPAAPPQVAQIFEQPGILTQPGHYVLEPSVQYGYSSSNRVALVGYTVIPAILIGLVDVREVKRSTLTMALTGRIGLTRRLEAEVRLPYVVRRDDAISREIFTGTASERVFNTRGNALGDVEVALRYQLNQPKANKPYYIAGLRFKTRTGKDPFEVVTDCITRCLGNTTGTGLPMDLPTGSGFYSLQSSLTWLLPSDPAVFFGSISYTHNFARSDVSRTVRNGEREYVGRIKPGDVFGINFGMGLAINDRSSFSIGIDLNTVGRTKQNGQPLSNSARLQMSTLLLGYSYRYNPRTMINVSVGAGLTRDTPDLTLSVRVPISF